jgi:ABC-type hemin transport system substrate-binding protein
LGKTEDRSAAAPTTISCALAKAAQQQITMSNSRFTVQSSITPLTAAFAATIHAVGADERSNQPMHNRKNIGNSKEEISACNVSSLQF